MSWVRPPHWALIIITARKDFDLSKDTALVVHDVLCRTNDAVVIASSLSLFHAEGYSPVLMSDIGEVSAVQRNRYWTIAAILSEACLIFSLFYCQL